MKHFFAFSIQLLMLQGLLDDEGKPQHLAGIITHLHYHEPGNLAFVYLLRSGALRELCTPEKDGTISKATQMNLVLVLSYLFAPLVLHRRAHNVKYNNSKVVLPPLPPKIKKVLEMYNEEVMCIYDIYFKCVAEGIANNLGEDVTLPMSGVRIMPREAFVASTEGPMSLERHLVEGCEPKVICSAFAALSGHSDRGLYSHYNMISNIRHQVFTDVKVVPIVELNKTYNGYAWDFYNHGIVAAIMNDNGLKQVFFSVNVAEAKVSLTVVVIMKYKV
ncbi:probable ATP-dependent RNA helicase DDX60 [Cryptotermes secundus]|uniref:probable ATP-dependent RNA helicase DDX60 n=2 Tax=Cryptotermes secundus TaxID=105785 RepID=UPI000CD7C053|nr:probable ATP-dependent RNA helicase DDX60 [Cryptotermes secundus]